MRLFWLAIAGLTMVLPAWAQSQPGQGAPLQQQWQQQGLPPVQQAPASPLPPDQSSSPAGQQAAPGPATMVRPNIWLPAAVAKVQVLDKVNAQTSTLTIKVGDSATFGSLTITARACVIRPADQPADAAVFLAVTDSHLDSPGFTGWMLENEPSISMMEHPIYDLRVVGCA